MINEMATFEEIQKSVEASAAALRAIEEGVSERESAERSKADDSSGDQSPRSGIDRQLASMDSWIFAMEAKLDKLMSHLMPSKE